MTNFNDIVNNDEFERHVADYAQVAREMIKDAEYNLETKDLGTGKDDLAMQEVRFNTPPISGNKKLNLARVRFFIVHRPDQEDSIDENDIYAKRSFPNYFYLVQEKNSGGVCEIQQMTGAFERKQDKVTVMNLATARKLIENLAIKAHVLELRLNEAHAKIDEANQTIDWARGTYDRDCGELVTMARVSSTQERD